MRRALILTAVCLALAVPGRAQEAAKLAGYFPPPESKGGWRSLLPDSGEPTEAQKTAIKDTAGVDWDRLADAWRHNAAAGGKSGLLAIRRGHVVGEWYKDCDRGTAFNIYSSSKAYTSLAFGLLLADAEAGKLPGGKKLSLETKVCTEEWLPEALPLPDPRKANITLRHLLNMTAGLDVQNPPAQAPFEWSLGKVEGSPMAKLKGEPGKTFHYSNAGVSHLVLVFNRAAGRDLLPFLKERVLDPVGVEKVDWMKIGGGGKIGPYCQGYSGVRTTAREHARFCHLALHRGEWAGKRLVPAAHYEFAWKGTEVKPEYGAQWWVYPRHKVAPRDMVQTAGARNNHGYVVPSLDLIVVRLGDGASYPRDFEQDLLKKVLAAVKD